MMNGLLIDAGELRTFTAYEPGVIRSAPLSVVVSVPSGWSVVSCSLPLKTIFDVGRNDEPVTTMSCDRTPAVIAPGETDVICGAKTLNGAGADVAPLSLTVICSVPAAAISVAETFVTSDPSVGLCVVERGMPFTFTIEVGLKLLPVTVSWNPLSPEIADVG